jgi:hypothetical protein
MLLDLFCCHYLVLASSSLLFVGGIIHVTDIAPRHVSPPQIELQTSNLLQTAALHISSKVFLSSAINMNISLTFVAC